MILLATLAMSLNRYIFSTCCLFVDDSDLRQRLLDLAFTNPEKEAFYRSVLLSINQGEDSTVIQGKKTFVIAEVVSSIRDLVSRDRLDAFQHDLNDIIDRTTQSWQHVQTKKPRYDATTDIRDGTHWQKYCDVSVGSPDSQTSRHRIDDDVTDEPILCVFPRVFVVGEEDNLLVFPGVIMTESQTTIAQEEMKKTASGPARVPSSRKDLRRFSNDTRTISSTMANGRGAFLG